MPTMTETETSVVARQAGGINLGPAIDPAQQAKAHEVVAYLSYVLEDVRALSGTGTFLLEMSIVALNEDMNLSQWSLQDFAGQA
jgi:hypothetical protein